MHLVGKKYLYMVCIDSDMAAVLNASIMPFLLTKMSYCILDNYFKENRWTTM
jgi:UDP-N-acetylglucosamine pyrophosphorylase